ncbi:MAG: zf-HC2 domain-containing protein [Chloroflexi bacterium]|nr:zf-HC2 domain-containing protein [Chloroflexota bacterium]
MTCEELLQYLSDYIDNELDEDLTAEARAHLATCHNCKVVLDTTRKTIFLYRERGKRAISAERRQELFDKLQTSFLGKASE